MSLSIALIVYDNPHVATDNTRAALERLGHSVQVIKQADVQTHDFSGYDALVLVRLSTDLSLEQVAETLRATGKPILAGGFTTGSQGTDVSDAFGISTYLKITGKVSFLRSGYIAPNDPHPIMQGIEAAVQYATDEDWSAVLDEGEPYVGVAFSVAGSGTGEGRPTSFAVDAGDLDLEGQPFAQRIVVLQSCYGFSPYTGHGEALLENTLRWLCGEETPALVGTDFSATNNAGGNCFNITNVSGKVLVLKRWWVYPVNDGIVRLYTRRGGWVDSLDYTWEFQFGERVESGHVRRLETETEIYLFPGETIGVYIYNTGSLYYTNGDIEQFSNSLIEFSDGVGVGTGGLGTELFIPRYWNGIVEVHEGVAPLTVTLYVDSLSAQEAELRSEARSFEGTVFEGKTHAASRWQVRTEGGSYMNPVFDSGWDDVNLTTIQVGGLKERHRYLARVQYKADDDTLSEWSQEVYLYYMDPTKRYGTRVDWTEFVHNPAVSKNVGNNPGLAPPWPFNVGKGESEIRSSEGFQRVIPEFPVRRLKGCDYPLDSVFGVAKGSLIRYEPTADFILKYSRLVDLDYLYRRPDTPTVDVVVIPGNRSVTIEGSEYRHEQGQPHTLSQAQVLIYDEDGTLVWDSGNDAQGTKIKTPELQAYGVYTSKLRYRDALDKWSFWGESEPFVVDVFEEKPSVTVGRTRPKATELFGSEYKHYNNRPHKASWWQVAREGTEFADLVYDSGWDEQDRLAKVLSVLEPGYIYEARLRYMDAENQTSDWGPATSFYVVFVPVTPNIAFIAIEKEKLTAILYYNEGEGNNGMRHEKTQWQITLREDRDYENPVVDTGWTEESLTRITIEGIELGKEYRARVRTLNSDGIDSDWSDDAFFILGTAPKVVGPVTVHEGEEASEVEESLYGAGFMYPFGWSEQSGGAARVSAVDSVKASLYRIFDTAPGEQFMLPEFGSGLKNLVFEQDTVAFRAMCETIIRDAVARWEPRVEEVLEVLVEDGPDDHTVNIRVFFRLIDSQVVHNMVYPFHTGR